MKLLLIVLSLLFVEIAKSQTTFSETSDVVSYMDTKSFSNDEIGMTISYGYISKYNTYGIIVVNKFDITFYYINVSVSANGSFANLYGMSPEDGSNFGFRLFNGRLVIGYGEEGSVTFYPN